MAKLFTCNPYTAARMADVLGSVGVGASLRSPERLALR